MSEKFQIHLQGTADAQQWVQAETQLKKLDSAASDFLNSLKAGVGIDLGGRLVNGVAQLQGLFTGLLERGYEFNKEMVQTQGSIANVLGETMKLDEQAAKQEAAKAMAAMIALEPKAAGTLRDLTEGFMATVTPAQAAGLSVAQNIDLVGKFANALANTKIPAEQLAQEMRSILTGNITSDSQFAKMRGITSEGVNQAKEQGRLYDYLIEKIGKLGSMGNGPAVVLSSLSSAIDKAAGSLSKGLFDEVIAGAQELTTILDDPDIKKGLEEAGVSIGHLVREGANLTSWAVQNAPALLKVAEWLFRIGAAIAAIKLTQIIAGLVLKATMWGRVTTAIEANNLALIQNAGLQAKTAAGGAASVGGAAVSTSAATAGGTAVAAAGGAAAAKGWLGGFSKLLRASGPLIIIADIMWLMDSAAKFLALHAEHSKDMALASKSLLDPKMGGQQSPAEFLRGKIEKASTPQDVAEARRLGGIMQRDAKADGNEVLLNQINAIMGKFDELTGKQLDHTKATQDAAAAEKALSAALIDGQAAAGDSAAKITQAANALEELNKKVSEATGQKIDTSSYDALVKSVQALNTSKLDADAIKNVTALIEAAGKLRDLKADAAKDAETQAEKQKKAADDLREAEIKRLELQSRAAAAADKGALSRDLQARADALKLRAELEDQGMTPETAAGVVKSEQGKDQAKLAKETAAEQARKELAMQVAALEDEIATKRADGDKQGEQAAQDRLAALQLARQLEDTLGLTRDQAEARAQKRIENERAASERDTFKGSLGDGGVGRSSGPARLSAADTWGDGRNAGGLRGNNQRDSLSVFNDQQRTPLRDTFRFPSLDAFEARQPAGAAGATPQKEGGEGNGANIAGAAKQAAEAAAKAREASAKTDADLLANFQKLSSELSALATQQQETSSQVAHSRA